MLSEEDIKYKRVENKELIYNMEGDIHIDHSLRRNVHIPRSNY